MERDSLARLLGQDVSVEEIAKRFGRHPSRVAYWMDKHGLVAPNRERYAPKGGIAKERLEALVDAGMSIAARRRSSSTTLIHRRSACT
jgi:transposase-like protein